METRNCIGMYVTACDFVVSVTFQYGDSGRLCGACQRNPSHGYAAFKSCTTGFSTVFQKSSRELSDTDFVQSGHKFGKRKDLFLKLNFAVYISIQQI